jgi:hypothetical protein
MRAIRGAVVDDDDFLVDRNLPNTLYELPDGASFVVGWYDY